MFYCSVTLYLLVLYIISKKSERRTHWPLATIVQIIHSLFILDIERSSSS